jgi:hypothetical protein
VFAQGLIGSCVVFDNSVEPVKSEKQWYGSAASSFAVAALPLRRLVPV